MLERRPPPAPVDDGGSARRSAALRPPTPVEPPGPGSLPKARSVGRAVAGAVVLGVIAVTALAEQVLGGGRGLVFGVMVITLMPSALRAGGMRFHPFDPETFVPLAFFLCAAYAPTFHLFTSTDLRLHEVEIMPMTLSFIGAAVCALVCTVASRPPEERGPHRPATPLTVTVVDHAVILTGLLGLSMIGTYVAMVGFDALLNMSYLETYQAEYGWGTLSAGWNVIQLATVYLVGRCVRFRHAGQRIPRLLLVMVTLCVLAFSWNTIMGRRGPLVWLVVSMVIMAHLQGLAIRRIWFVVGVVVVNFYAFAIEGARSNLGQGVRSQMESAEERLSAVDNPMKVAELEAVWNTMLIVVTEKPLLVAYPGESLVSAILMQVPLPIWPDRPRAMTERFVMWVNPVVARAGGGYTFTAAAEGYINFGEVGVAVEIALLTYLCFGPMSACMRRRRSSVTEALVVCFGTITYGVYRGEVGATLKHYLAFSAAALVILVLSPILRSLQAAGPAERPARAPSPRAPVLSRLQ